MQLTVRDISKLVNVSERTVYRWIKDGAIPAYKIHDQYRFNRSEIMDWAAANKIGVSHELFREPDTEQIPPSRLTDALQKGGIHYRVGGGDKPSVLNSIVGLLPVPEDVNREFLLGVFLAREEMGSTGIGDGIAIPHARNPIVFNIPDSMISLCFLSALDGKPVNTLFTLITPTARVHLLLLSQLAYALKDAAVKKAILKQASREVILKEIRRVEDGLRKPNSTA
jgi:PTS system nitrogen regulatory IIA component